MVKIRHSCKSDILCTDYISNSQSGVAPNTNNSLLLIYNFVEREILTSVHFNLSYEIDSCLAADFHPIIQIPAFE
jgi:hypothetical protein